MRNKVFLSWKRLESIPSALRPCVDSFAKVNQGSRIEFQSDEDCLDFVAREFPEFLPTYLSYPPGILRADIWRVLVLYKYGGVYADIDVECLRPLEELLAAVGHDDWELLLTTDHPVHERMHFGGRTMWMNDFMIAKPGARFLKRVIDAFVAQGGGEHHPAEAVMVTGPGLFSRLVEEAGGPEAAGITPLPWQWIHPLPDMSNEFPEKEEYLRKIRERTWREEHDPFVVHYWHHTWCRSGNILHRWGHLLHQTDGEIVERRLWRMEEEAAAGGETAEAAEIHRLGRGLAEFANTEEKILWVMEENPAAARLAARALAGLGRELICPDGPVRRSLGETAGVTVVSPEENAATSPFHHPLTARLLPPPVDWKAVAEQHGAPGLAVAGTSEDTWEAAALIRPGGFLLTARAPDEEFPAGWERVESLIGDEAPLYRKTKEPVFFIPRVIHLLSAGGGEADHSAEDDRWRKAAGADWTVRRWTAEEVTAFVRDEAGEFYDDWRGYKSERSRTRAARYLILAKHGGAAPEPGFPLTADLREVLADRRLVFGGRERAEGAVLSHANAIDGGFIASEAGHPFWTGIVEDLAQARGQEPNDECGNGFLTRRVRDGLRYWKKEDWPVVLALEALRPAPVHAPPERGSSFRSEVIYFDPEKGFKLVEGFPNLKGFITKTPRKHDVIAYTYAANCGLGEAAAKNIQAMRDLGLTVEHRIWKNELINESALNDPDQVFYHHWHPQPDDRGMRVPREIFGKARHIAFYAYETDSLPAEFQMVSDALEEIWVPSGFCKKVFSTLGRPVHVVPHAVDPSISSAGPLPGSRGDRPVTVLFLFDAWSRLPRKNPEAVLRVFKKAFPNGNSVRLIIKAHHLSPVEYYELHRLCGRNHWITIVDDFLSEQALSRLFLDADILLSLQRSEGFGLNLAKAQAYGIPIITTAYGGHLDFCEDTAFLVGYKLEDVTRYNDPWYPEGHWAEPNEEEAVGLLRSVVEKVKSNCPVLTRRRLKGQQIIHSDFSDTALKDRLRERLAVFFPKLIFRNEQLEAQRRAS